MTDIITIEEIDSIAESASKASPGTWEWEEWTGGEGVIWTGDSKASEVSSNGENYLGNARAIIALVNAAPKLLATARAYHEAIQYVCDECDGSGVYTLNGVPHPCACVSEPEGAELVRAEARKEAAPKLAALAKTAIRAWTQTHMFTMRGARRTKFGRAMRALADAVGVVLVAEATDESALESAATSVPESSKAAPKREPQTHLSRITFAVGDRVMSGDDGPFTIVRFDGTDIAVTGENGDESWLYDWSQLRKLPPKGPTAELTQRDTPLEAETTARVGTEEA